MLPRCPAHRLVEHGRDKVPATQHRLDGRCVLLLEDQPHVRHVFRRQLVSAGAEVHAVSTGEEAMAKYGLLRDGGVVPVCVFDLLIEGGMGGVDTLAELRRKWPDVMAIACSGHAEVDMATSYRSFGFRDYLAKPFGSESLIQAVHDQFAASESS